MYALEVAVEPKPEILKRLRQGRPALVVVLDLQSGGMPRTIKEIKGAEAIVEFTSTLPAIRPGMRADVRLKRWSRHTRGGCLTINVPDTPMEFLATSLLELITQTSTNLPPDVRAAMSMAAGTETPGTQSSQALDIILSNVDMAVDDEGPICQDTGMPTFFVHTPIGVNQIRIKGAILEAVAEATRLGKLRPNSVDSLTGKNSGNNLGEETPVIHFEQWEEDEIDIRLILKGGGCENKNIQYSVPCELDHLGRADRNLEGVRKCILHSVWQAQGQGCAPGAVKGFAWAAIARTVANWRKRQLLRTLDDVNPNATLAALEAEIMEEANRLGVGAMGFGGKASLIGCKIAVANRLPASFFVSVAYDCWAFRRLGVRLDAGDWSDHAVALSRPCAARRAYGAWRRLPADRPRSRPHAAADRGANARAPCRRCRADPPWARCSRAATMSMRI